MNAASWPDDDPQIHPADISLPPTQPIIIVIPKDSAATPPAGSGAMADPGTAG